VLHKGTTVGLVDSVSDSAIGDTDRENAIGWRYVFEYPILTYKETTAI
jgi:hypothetical protein